MTKNSFVSPQNGTVRVDKCPCGCREFTFRFVPGKVRSCTIVADCIGCGRGRVVSLDKAHKAMNGGRR
jgi:hypothetical protein